MQETDASLRNRLSFLRESDENEDFDLYGPYSTEREIESELRIRSLEKQILRKISPEYRNRWIGILANPDKAMLALIRIREANSLRPNWFAHSLDLLLSEYVDIAFEFSD